MSVEIFNKLLEHRAEFMGMLLQGRLADMNHYSYQKMKDLNLSPESLMQVYRSTSDETELRSKLTAEFQGDSRAANGFALGIQVQDLMLDYLQLLSIKASHENPEAMELDMRRVRQETAKNLGEIYELGDAQCNEIVRRFEAAANASIAKKSVS